MADDFVDSDSGDEIVQRTAWNRAAGDDTPLGSFTMSAADSRPKKNVKWLLGQASDEHGPSDSRSPDDDERPESSEAAYSRPVSHGNQRERLPDDTSHEELRNRIHEIFTDQPPSHASPKSPLEAGQRPLADQRSRPLPKSVLRSGASTPVVTVSPPEPNDEIDDLEGKTRSANRAKQEAEDLSRDLAAPKREAHKSWRSLFQGRHSRSRTNSPPAKRLPSLYHDGPDLLVSGQTTPDVGDDNDHVPKPSKYRMAGLSAQLFLEKASHLTPSRRNSWEDPLTPGEASHRPLSPGHNNRPSLTSIPALLSSSAQFGSIAGPSINDNLVENAKAHRPAFARSHSDTGDTFKIYRSGVGRSSSSNLLDTVYHKAVAPSKKKRSKEVDIRIKKHIEETRLRQRYLLRLCQALMEYGAPTHRLEEYMRMSARVLETEAQFLYIPGCMIVAFDDSNTHTTEVKLVKVNQGVDLGKLSDTHEVYKQVVHDTMGVKQAADRLDDVIKKHKKFRVWFLVLVHGVASATVAPFAFQGRLIDLPIAFFLGLLLGFLRLVVASKSDLYSSIFEVTSVILTSFLSRAFGSLQEGHLFCFSALAQSSIALILPGYIVLCGSLELQSRSIVAGSVRLVYAIIYSLFIGFGLTIGTAIYGLIDHAASSSASCSDPIPPYWSFFFVPVFALCLMIINQAKWSQTPVMMLIACAGYLVSYFSSKRFLQDAPVSSALAAVAISVLANLYSRVGLTVDKFAARVTAQLHAFITHGRPPAVRDTDTDDVEKQSQAHAQHERHPSTASSSSIASTTTLSEPEPEPASTTTRHGDSTDARDATRVNHSLAAAAMLPAIFVLVPSGLSVQGSLLQGTANADAIVHNSTTATSSSGSLGGSDALVNNTALNVGINVVQVAIGITVGLFIGTLVVYPFGKGGKWGGRGMRSGLFTL